MDRRWVDYPKAPKVRTVAKTIRWVCAEDRQPEHNGNYLACSKNGDIWMPFYHSTVKTWWLGGMEITQIVWYWEEIPDVPKEGEKA